MSEGMALQPTPRPERLPLTAIPADLTCILCEERRERPFAHEGAFRGHMWSCHQILYERREPKGREKPDWSELQQSELRTTLEPWHAVAIAQHELFGKPWSQIAEEMRGGRGAHTMREVSESPAGEALRTKIADIVGDPMQLVKLLMQEHMLQAFADHLAAREWARDAKDYKALHAMNRDIDLMPLLETMKKPQQMGTPTLVVQLNGGKLDTAEIKTDYVVVDAEVVAE